MSLDVNEMKLLQQRLQERYAGWWEPVDPEHGRNKLLWMLAEMGEAIQLLKRNESEELMNNAKLRHDFIEEMADVMMYLNDVLLCFDIKPEEFEEVYRAKHERNMTRWKKPGE